MNNKFNAFIMQKLEAAGIPTQFDKLLSDTECLVKKLDMIPVDHSGISPCGAHDTSLYEEREAFLKIFSRSFRWLRAFRG